MSETETFLQDLNALLGADGTTVKVIELRLRVTNTTTGESAEVHINTEGVSIAQ